MTLCKTIGLACCCQPDDGVPCPYSTIEQVVKWGHEWRDAALKAQAAHPAQASQPIGYVAEWVPEAVAREACSTGILVWGKPTDLTGLVPLYAAPARAAMVPLSDEQIAKCYYASFGGQEIPSTHEFARAIERAHGIGGTTPADGREAGES